MRIMVALVLLVALVASTVLLGLFDSGLPEAPPDASLGSERERDEETRHDPLRTGLPTVVDSQGPDRDQHSQDSGAKRDAEKEVSEEKPAEVDADSTSLALEVFDRTTGRRVESFHFVLVDGDQPRRDEFVQGSQHDLVLPNDRDLKLTIEAEGFMPQTFQLRFAYGERVRKQAVQLEPAARATGITLFVTDSRGQAIEAIDVKAEMLALEVDPARPMRTLWQRNTQNEKGEYHIPELAPGQYRFTVQAMRSTDPANPSASLEQRLLVPVSHSTRFHGSEILEPRLVLREGGQIDLTVFGPRGQRLGGQTAGKSVSLRLRLGERKVAVDWRAEVEGKILEAGGQLPAAVKCSLSQPIAPGTYLLDLRREQGPIVTRTLVVRAGVRLPLRVDMPE